MLKSSFPYLKNFWEVIVLGIICVMALWECAFKVAPSGGPEDKTPPEILFTFPKPDSTNIANLSYFEFHFSESVDKASFRNETWLLPELPNGYELKWKGNKKLHVVLNDSLEKDQTYIFTIGTGVKDVHGNKLPSPFVLPFSTGSKIDQGEISGKVFEKKAQGIFIYAYQVSDTFSEQTVFKRKPRYYTQTGNNGDYKLNYLKEATYRVYALEDKNGDKKYTLQTDRVGIPFEDITITSQHIQYSEINFHLIREDTTAPQFVRSDTVDNHVVELSFNEPLKEQSFYHVEIVDSSKQTLLPIVATSLKEDEPSRLLIFTQSQNKVKYSGTIYALQDTSGNSNLKDTTKFSFMGAVTIDTTTKRVISLSPRNGNNDINFDTKIELHFSYPVDSLSLKSGFQLISQDSIPVQGRWEFESLIQPQYIPDTLLGKDENYQIQLDLGKIKTIFGEPFDDSLLSSDFKTKDWAQLGEIGGRVFSNDSLYKVAIIWASPMRGAGYYSTSAEVGKPYQILFLPEGLYHVAAGIDINQNRKIDKGSGLPFRFAEPFKALPDTVKVRKRWTTEGINFEF